MNFLTKSNQRSQIIIRVISDIVVVNAILLGSLVLQGFWNANFNNLNLLGSTISQEVLQSYLSSFWLLTLIAIPVFYLFGFYTHGRSYLSEYKMTRIIQAVGIVFLLFSFIVLMLWNVINFPRSVLVIAWLLTTIAMVGGRVWMAFWRVASSIEQKIIPSLEEGDQKIRNVLVVGGGGYIGSALTKRMLENGYHVRLLDLLLFGTEPIQDLLDHPNLEIYQADCRHVHEVLKAMKGMDAVIHLGAIVGDPACAYDEDLTIDVNLMATRLVAEVAKSVGVKRFIFASTCSVYGAGDEILDERSELNPVSLYARSKIASEQVLLKMADADFTPVILRFGTIYGLSGRTRFDLVINLLTAKGLVDGEITVFGGDQWRPFVHVQDAALGVFKALECPHSVVANQIFNIGSNDQNYTIQQIGDLIHEMIPSAELINMGADADPRNYRVDFSKARNMLGLVPEWTVEKGIQQVKAAIDSGKVTNYKDAKYSNLRFLKDHGMPYFKQSERPITEADLVPTKTTIKMNYDMPFTENVPNDIHKKDWVTELVVAVTPGMMNGANGAGLEAH